MLSRFELFPLYLLISLFISVTFSSNLFTSIVLFTIALLFCCVADLLVVIMGNKWNKRKK